MAYGDDLTALLHYLERLMHDLLARDGAGVRRVLAEREAPWLPRGVVAEGYAVMRHWPDGHRAPLQLLRFYYVMQQLHADGADGWRPRQPRPADAAELDDAPAWCTSTPDVAPY